MKPDKIDWYWDVPQFDRNRWWERCSDAVNKDATWYETLRRHPKVGTLLLGGGGSGLSTREIDLLFGGVKPGQMTLLQILGDFALSNWLSLTELDQVNFSQALRKHTFGKAHRPKPCVKILHAPKDAIAKLPNDWTNKHMPIGERLYQRPNMYSDALKPDVFVADARAAAENGKLVLAVDLDTPNPKLLVEQFKKIYHRVYRKQPRFNDRATTTYLNTISEYEKSEERRRKSPRSESAKKVNHSKRAALRWILDGLDL